MDKKILMENLDNLGVDIGDSTIRKYVLEGLVPAPTTRSLGRGLGRSSEYPDDAQGQIYAAWKLLNGPIQTSIKLLKDIRTFALELLEHRRLEVESPKLQELGISWTDLAYLTELWINYREEMKWEYTKYRVDVEGVKSDIRHISITQTKLVRTRSRFQKGFRR